MTPFLDDDYVHVNWASSHCQPFSTMGSRRGFSDPRCLPFLIWIQERLTYREPCVFFENASTFPVECVRELMEPLYTVMSVIIKPENCGYPIHRPRTFVFALLQESFVWAGPSQAEMA
eukprot:15440961-Alexandrium_andersonii.AAC.1